MNQLEQMIEKRGYMPLIFDVIGDSWIDWISF